MYRRAAFTSWQGKFVHAEGGGNIPLTANASEKGPREVFEILDSLDNGFIALKTCSRYYIGVDPSKGNQLSAGKMEIGEAEKFRLINRPDGKIALQSALNNMYVTVQDNGTKLLANCPSPGNESLFTISYIPSLEELSLEQIVKFAPVVYFKSEENFLPVSIDYILEFSKLNAAGRMIEPPITQKTLADNPGEGNFLIINPAIFGGQRLNEAPMYVVPQIAWDGSFIDLNFVFLHAYNGPQSISVKTGFKTYDAAIRTYAEHQGDLEGVTVRVLSDFSAPVFVRYEAHGDSTFYFPSQVKFLHGFNPVVFSAISSHATYNPLDHDLVDDGTVTIETHKIAEIGVDIRDFVKPQSQWDPSSDPCWQPFDIKDGRPYPNGKLIIAGVDNKGNPVNDQLWAKFKGRIGKHQINSYDAFYNLGLTERTDVPIGPIVEKCISNDKKEGNGPQGLGSRDMANVKKTIYKWPGLICVHRGSSDTNLWWSILGVDSDKGQADMKFTCDNRSSAVPALARFRGITYCVHKGASDADLWWSQFNKDKLEWTEDRQFSNGNKTGAGPALAVFRNNLYCVHRGNNDHFMWWSVFDHLRGEWTEDRPFENNNQTACTPALAVYRDVLYCVHRGNNDPNLWWTTFDPESGQWAEDRIFENDNRTAAGPAIAVFKDKLYCVHRGNSDTNLWWTFFNPQNGQWEEDKLFTRDNHCGSTPGLAVLDYYPYTEQKLYCAHPGAKDIKIWMCEFDPNSNSWSEDQKISDSHASEGIAILNNWL